MAEGEAIALRLEAIATRVEAIATRFLKVLTFCGRGGGHRS